MKYALIQVLPDVPAGGCSPASTGPPLITWRAWSTWPGGSPTGSAPLMTRPGSSADHPAARGRGQRGRDRAGRRRARRGAAGRGPDGGGDQLPAGEEPAVAIRGRLARKDDRFDAFVLADTLRTDRARLRPLVPDAPATITLRAAVRARRDLVAHRVAACNQLRAHLAVAFPAAVGLFRDLDSPISLAFLTCFGSQDAAGQLDEQAIAAWLKTIPVRGRPAPVSVLCARLRAAPARRRPGRTVPPRQPSPLP